jgi:hypothetical protein
MLDVITEVLFEREPVVQCPISNVRGSQFESLKDKEFKVHMRHPITACI